MTGIFSMPMTPRVLDRITPQRMELATILVKERRKRVRYLGSMWHHFGDRHCLYSSIGGYDGSVMILTKTNKRNQYHHPGMWTKNTWQLRQVKKKGGMYDNYMGYTRDRWDQQLFSTSLFNEGNFKRHFRGMKQDTALEFMEAWGFKFVVMDELRKPSVVDTMYWKHKLYAHNFPWIRDPVTNSRVGDADYAWKGTEKLDYSVYGATTKDPKNDFTTLWKRAVADMKEPGVQTVESAVSAAAAPLKEKKPRSKKPKAE